MFDRYNREIYYLRISVTDKCNLRCTYCMPAEGVPHKSHEELLSFEEIEQIVAAAVELGFRKFRLTGGEPLVRRGIVELVTMLKTMPGTEFLGMTTNGTLLAPVAADLRAAGLDGINISLDTLDARRYTAITRGGRLEDVLSGVEAALAAGFTQLKLNTVVDESTTAAELEDLTEFCRERGIKLQRIRQYSLLEAKSDEAEFERPPRCGECNRLRLTCDGFFKPCLHSNTEIPVDFGNIAASIRQTVDAKPDQGAECSTRPMAAIGG